MHRWYLTNPLATKRKGQLSLWMPLKCTRLKFRLAEVRYFVSQFHFSPPTWEFAPRKVQSMSNRLVSFSKPLRSGSKFLLKWIWFFHCEPSSSNLKCSHKVKILHNFYDCEFSAMVAILDLLFSFISQFWQKFIFRMNIVVGLQIWTNHVNLFLDIWFTFPT